MNTVTVHYWSKALIPTLKENPQEAQIKSHRLMLRAGLVRKLASGTYTYLPLGLRALKKAEAIVREEMDKAGALELLMPAIHPAELWKETGRWDIMGEDMVRFKDRHGKENVLGPTHEEVITDLARREIHSYKQLPVNLYQIQTKFRDEMRPRSGIIRSREFLMKDAYSFHPDDACLDRMYQLMRETYKKIFTRCGLEFFIVQADPGAMGGTGSQEFVLFSDAGEDRMVQLGDSDTVVSVEMAKRTTKGLKFPTEYHPTAKKLEKVNTPGHSSVESVVSFLNEKMGLNKQPKDLLKTMIYQTSDDNGLKIIAVLVRGDHDVSEYKVKEVCPGAILASREKIESLGTSFGFSGPIGLGNIPFYVDEDVLSMKGFVIGANQKDHHLINVNLSDIKQDNPTRQIISGDFRQVVEGDRSPEGQPLKFRTAIELGHIFKLNLRYTKPLEANYLDANGKENPLVMGCYGIGVNRILAAAIEQYGDEKGIIWPKNISPYQIQVILIDPKDEQSREIVKNLMNSPELAAQGTDILVDDRTDSAGIKFNDADLLGIPLRIILGPKNLKNGKVEIKLRKTGEQSLVDIPKLVPEILSFLDKLA